MGTLEIMLGIACIGFGLACLFAKNFVWSWSETWRWSFEGIRVVRTWEWDVRQNISGILCITLGIMCLSMGYVDLTHPIITREMWLPPFYDLKQAAIATARVIASN